MTSATRENCDSYTTPILWKNGDRLELVVMGGQMLDAYEPATGKLCWQLPGLLGSRTITGPVAGNGMIFATQGKLQAMLAVRPRGDGRRTHEDVAWQLARARPQFDAGGLGNRCFWCPTTGSPAASTRKRPVHGRTSVGRVPRLADGRRRTHLLPEYPGLTTVGAASPLQPSGRGPRGRRHAGLAGVFRRPDFHSELEDAVLHWEVTRFPFSMCAMLPSAENAIASLWRPGRSRCFVSTDMAQNGGAELSDCFLAG